jgi:hypothetical protein
MSDRAKRLILLLVMAAALAALLPFAWRTAVAPGLPGPAPGNDDAGAEAEAGGVPLRIVPSSKLRQTVLLPTLDSPLPQGKSAIWCCSFQLAWNKLKAVAGETVVLGAEEMCARLNRAPQSEADLEPGSFYTAVGRIEEGIAAKIRQDLHKQFPEAASPDPPPEVPEGWLCYGFLKAGVRYESP